VGEGHSFALDEHVQKWVGVCHEDHPDRDAGRIEAGEETVGAEGAIAAAD
jgi:hypothetical protein